MVNNNPATHMNSFVIDETLTRFELERAASFLLRVQPIDEAAVVNFSEIM
jgi:hypothetical protein